MKGTHLVRHLVVLATFAAAFGLPGAARATEQVATARAQQVNAIAAMTAEAFVKLNLAQRRAHIATLDKAAIEALYKATPFDALLEAGKKNALALGTYYSKVHKQERVDGELIDTQQIETYVREKPHAVRMKYVDGPGAGRNVCFNSALPDRGREIRVKEAGFAGIVGAIWLDMDSGLTRKESNYAVTSMGLGAMLRQVERQMAGARPEDYDRVDEGLGGHDRYFVKFVPKKKNLVMLRLGFDVSSGIPTLVEVHEAIGLRERHDWRDVAVKKVAKDFFTPEAAGL